MIRRVKWLGHRRVDTRNHPRPQDIMPVRVMAHAFAENQPSRDLYLSPDHSVFVGGVLIPVRYLLNGTTISQQSVDAVTYWHVELSDHDIILAEGLPCESYLETGNRGAFANSELMDLYPTFERSATGAWADEACAPHVESGPYIDAVRARLVERAAALGYAGSGVHELALDRDGCVRTTVPAGVETLQLVSSSCRLAGDRRVLGALLMGLRIDGVAVALDDASLGLGFHEVEAHDARQVRWTSGLGEIVIGASEFDRVIEVDVATLGIVQAQQQQLAG